MHRKVLIFGITGQDGSYLAKFLLSKKYTVFGTSRYLKENINLLKLKINKKVRIYKLNPKNSNEVKNIIKEISPNEIYYLSGISSISEANKYPLKAFESIVVGSINVLEAVKSMPTKKIKIFFAGSTECYGNLKNKKSYFNENSFFQPINIYSIAKSTSFTLVKKYREYEGLWCCTGILSNHESSLRSKKYVSKKIVSAAKSIYLKNKKILKIGNINISRDWGWAPEYVEAFWKMLNCRKPKDYIVATGQTYSLKQFINFVFKYYGLNWKKYVVFSAQYSRKSDLKFTKFNTKLINSDLKWKAKIDLPEIIEKMINDEY